MSKKPTVLLILDGYGLNDKKEGNAVALANTCLRGLAYLLIVKCM